jgi:curved DNA-binding protein CbpA
MIDYYEVLGIPVDATAVEISIAYRRLRGTYHPDKPTGDAELFQNVREAFEHLSNPVLRKEYDKTKGEGQYRRATEKLKIKMVEMIEKTPAIGNVDYVLSLQNNINAYIKGIDVLTAELKKYINKYVVACVKIKTKGNRNKNIFEPAINEKISELKRKKEQLKNDGDVAKLMLEILEYYESDIQHLLGIYHNDYR